MLMFSEFKRRQKDVPSAFSLPVSSGGYNFNAVIMQMQTGEGKSIVIAMLAIFVCKQMGKKVHVLENNEGLLERDYETYAPYYDRFGLTTAKQIDPEADICYCLKRENNKYFTQQLVEGKLDLENIILIVDEVDDLVVNESPYVAYMKADTEKTPEYRRVYGLIKGGATSKPADVDRPLWKDCQRIVELANTKKEHEDYMVGNNEYLMLEKLKDGTSRVPKVKLSDDWLEYLNFRQFNTPPQKRTFYAGLCTPFMYANYSCIFGLTGSVGGPAEKEYIKNTYRAVSYEVPQFLTTCKGEGKKEAVNLGVELFDNTDQQVQAVVRVVKENYQDVSILVITRDPREINKIYKAIEMQLVNDEDEPMEAEHLQRLREFDDEGTLLKPYWNTIIADTTKRVGSRDGSSCFVTVTDYFGGRGHDYNVMDQQTNDNGGMLVIATSMPDTREWIQWKGRTARQDRPGQFTVLLSKQDAPFKGNHSVFSKFRSFTDDQNDEKIEYLLALKDSHIRETLERYSSDQAKGAWLNELSQKYYKAHPRAPDAPWPPTSKDRTLRDALSKRYKNGEEIKQHARDAFGIELTGPPAEWSFSKDKEFIMAPGELKDADIAVLFVIDVSFSMDETDPTQDQRLSGEAKRVHDSLVTRLAGVGAELGALTISLMWWTNCDLDLHCKTTQGEEIFFSNKGPSRCGGRLDVDMTSVPAGGSAVENIFWIQAPPGRYEFWVHNYSNSGSVNFWIREKHKGKIIMHEGRTDQAGSNSRRFQLDYVDPLRVRSQTRLQTATECISTIIREQLKDEDQIGLMTFATDVVTDFQPMVKRGNEAFMVNKVNSMRTRGRTACYSAIRQAAERLRTMDPDISKWVVALTDGKDTDSNSGDVSQAAQLFKTTENLNFAMISLGNEVDVPKVNQMVTAAEQGSNKGMLVPAHNMNDVKQAFEDIAKSMTAPTAGAM